MVKRAGRREKGGGPKGGEKKNEGTSCQFGIQEKKTGPWSQISHTERKKRGGILGENRQGDSSLELDFTSFHKREKFGATGSGGPGPRGTFIFIKEGEGKTGIQDFLDRKQMYYDIKKRKKAAWRTKSLLALSVSGPVFLFLLPFRPKK